MNKAILPGASAATHVAAAQPQGNAASAGEKPRPCLVRTRAAASRDARLVASGILEVLAGVQTPSDAAKALGVSVPRYYLWEQRALEGLVRACEPRPKGKVASERHRIAVLEKEVTRLRQECVRQQALVRAAQRTIALAAASPAAKSTAKAGEKTAAQAAAGHPRSGSAGVGGKAKRKHRPVARALKAAATFREPIVGDAVDSSTPSAADVVQRSVASGSPTAAESVPAAASTV
jgi:hypothetical protein